MLKPSGPTRPSLRRALWINLIAVLLMLLLALLATHLAEARPVTAPPPVMGTFRKSETVRNTKLDSSCNGVCFVDKLFSTENPLYHPSTFC